MTTTPLVLVADDDPFNLRLLQEVCEAAGYRVVTATDGTEVLDMVAREQPALVMLDVAMPGLDGFEVLRILKSDPGLAPIPVILVTATQEVDARSRGIELGAEDYVTKPYRVFEVQQRIRNALRVQAAEAAAAEAREQLQGSDLVDPLTHAGTVRQLSITLDYEHTRAARYGHALSCIVVRVQNFEDVVHRAGREAGDGVLVQLASGLRQCVRSVDHIFRSDLDEFTILLPETAREGAQSVLDRIEARAGDKSLWGVRVEPDPEIRAGMASFPDEPCDAGEKLRRLALVALARRER